VIKPIKATPLAHNVSFPGLIEAEPSKVINVLPPVTGRLIELKARLGQQVAKDQVLGVIESADLALAYADHDKALSALSFAHDTLKRAQQVHRAGGNSIKDIEAAQTSFLQAEAELKRTDATLKTLGQHTFSLLTIKAPISGQIIALNDGVGSYITDLTAPVMTIVNTDKLWVTAYISEKLAGAIQKNLLAEVSLPAYPGEYFKGTVTFVSSFLDADTRRNKTRIAFENPKGKFQPNMFATVKIAIPQPDQIIIPLSAILMSNDTTSIFVEQSPWTFTRRDIRLGMQDGDQVRILSGLKPGERVVISGGVLVND
jgi:cobalt-zinc-cadmium efflux system membrane fusion protein